LQELFKRTVGPIKELFIIYNNQARSKGMGVVTFQRTTDAVLARSKYNGKVIDGSKFFLVVHFAHASNQLTEN
jgi:THO complex subunit 4